jgi:hypothetical protein
LLYAERNIKCCYFFASYDGGVTWNKKLVFGACEDHDGVENIAFLNSKIGLLGLEKSKYNFGYRKGYYLTKDGGDSWTQIDLPEDTEFISNGFEFLFSTLNATYKVDANGSLGNGASDYKHCVREDFDALYYLRKLVQNDTLFSSYYGDCGIDLGYSEEVFSVLAINNDVLTPKEVIHFTEKNNVNSWTSVTPNRRYGGIRFGYMSNDLDSFYYMVPPKKSSNPLIDYSYGEFNSQYFNDTLGYHLGVLNDTLVLLKINGNQGILNAVSSGKQLKSVGIDILEIDSKVICYPNPAINIINISGLNPESEYELNCYSIEGKLIFTSKSSYSESWSQNIELLNEGMYVLKVETSDGEESSFLKFRK